MPEADVRGTTLYYERRGSGEPLLLIQGLSGTHLSWGEPFLDALGDGVELLTYDHRGAGRSARHGEPFSIADLADDAAALLGAAGWERAHVLGISMGGMVAQELALRHPDRVRTLVLGCTFPGGPQARLPDRSLVQGLAAAAMSGDRERALRAGYAANVSAAFAADPANWGPYAAMANALPVAMAVIMLQMQAVARHNTAARLGGLRVPTLIVHGTEDRMLPIDNGRLLARLIPGARLELLDGVGHMFWWEQPRRSAALVRAAVLDQ